jgi:predicted NAD/FAD-binding protein
MPFEARQAGRRRIAVVGAGISGLGAALDLSADCDVVLYEAEGRLGGHARTVMAGRNGDQPVDTGFIVFNRPNYPNLMALFERLNVPIAKSDMSFSASLRGGRLEYGLRTLGTLFAQPGNAADPRFLAMVRDIFRFNARALDLAAGRDLTIRELLVRLGTGDWFRDYYIAPLSGAIWSTPAGSILDFPAETLVRFFKNHALLSATGQHQWYTVNGGSRQYVARIEALLDRSGAEIRRGAAVQAIRRHALGVEIKARGGDWDNFDDVVLATHADDSLRLLADASPLERQVLGDIRYQPNRAVLHADSSVMPRRRKVWSSWNYAEADHGAGIDLTYWMNSLQPIPMADPLFVTLNASRPIDPRLVYDEVTFRHPVYDKAALAAQTAIRAMNGTARTWFCGAWMKNGFHEDGLASALEVTARLRAETVLSMAAE